MKRILSLWLSIFILLWLAFPLVAMANPENLQNEDANSTVEATDPTLPPVLDAEGAILIEQETGKILFEKNKDKQLYPASTTKILTALLAIENGNLNEIVTVGNEANLAPGDGSIACLDLGEKISLKNLITGLMVASGNDAALTIGAHIGRIKEGDPSMEYQEALNKFCGMMNARANQLGATNSHFSNPHGYHDQEHYTTAHDLALIAREAMKHDFFREVIQKTLVEYPDWNDVDKNDPSKKQIRYWLNKNRLLDKNNKKCYYPFATGIKTGYTSNAMHCLVSSATKDGINLIAVILKSTKDGQWADSQKLLEYGFTNFQFYELLKEGQVLHTTEVKDHASEDSGKLEIIATKGIRDIIRKDDINKIEKTIEWHYIDQNNQLLLEAPIAKGQVLGKVVYKLNGSVIGESDLLAAREVMKKKTIIDIVTPKPEKEDISLDSYSWAITIVIIVLFINILIYMVRRRSRKRNSYRRRY
jgi:D-alanyl-D-alanine carboxypeptidase (penicillin-binding protein 5/6)